MTEHTPGPWRTIERDGYDGISVIGANSYDVALVKKLVGVNADQYTANACLIAAAPELLAACKIVLSRFKKAKRDYMPRPMGQDEVIPVLEDAIAKATNKDLRSAASA
jgi:hypothetical protein